MVMPIITPIFLWDDEESQANSLQRAFKFKDRATAEARITEAARELLDKDCSGVDFDKDKYQVGKKWVSLDISTSWLETDRNFYLVLEDTNSHAVFYAICDYLTSKHSAR
jgi:hypothetical protein